MEQTVYADLLFMINFSMDFLCLYLVAKLLAKPFSLLRGALSSTLGGIYAVAALFLSLPALLSVTLDVLVCFLMCLIAFARRKERLPSLFLLTAAYFFSSMLLGGIMSVIFNFLNRHSPPPESLAGTEEMPLWLFAAVAVVASLFTRIGGSFLRRRSQIKSADVEVRIGKRKAVLRAMCDSGNLLRDSISGRPVIISDRREAVNLLPLDCPPISDWGIASAANFPTDIASRIRMIPASTAGGEGLILALRPDSVVIRVGKHTHSSDALIGFADIRCALSDCNALIPSELIL